MFRSSRKSACAGWPGKLLYGDNFMLSTARGTLLEGLKKYSNYDTLHADMFPDIKITAESLTSPAAQFSIQRNGETVSSRTNVGVHVALFNAINGQVITTQSFNMNETREKIELEACLKNAPIGSIIAITSCGNVSDEIKRVCTTVGSHLIHSFSPGKNWALVGIKGTAPALAHEMLESPWQFHSYCYTSLTE